MRRRQAWGRSAACLVLAVAGSAVSARAQSPFSLVDIGAPAPVGDARVLGRGGWGLAESDTLAPSFLNPAGLPGLRQVALALSGYGESIRSRGAAGSSDNSRVMTPDAAVALPLGDGRTVFATGFHSRRSTQYSTSEPQAWYAGSELLATGDLIFTREGTQFAVPVTLARRVARALSLAATLNLERGAIRERVDNFFTDAVDSITYRRSSLVREDDFSGTSASFGLQWHPTGALALGAVYTTPWDYDVARRQEVYNVSGVVDSSYTVSMPAAWGVGASARLARRWSAGADYERRALSELRGRPDWEAAAADEWRLGVGCERAGARVRRGGWNNLPLRFGVSRGQWGYRVGGEPIREWRVAAGTGFVFSTGGGRVDVGLSYGRVGDRARNGYVDDVWRLSLSVVGLERWW
ncbi:MAG: hypothetical protein ACYDIE_12980 [Candidatus Krumholzibacteriia bacterium]